jgi:hypothetical protein
MNITTDKNNKQGLVGYDFHGTLNSGIAPEKDAVVISGAKEGQTKDIQLYLKKIGREDMRIYALPSDENDSTSGIARWKSKIIKELGIKTYYDEHEGEIAILRKLNPDLNIIEVPVYHWVTFSMGWDGMPIAYHLQNEGTDSVVGMIQSKKEIDQEDDEEPEDKEQRISQYDGMIKKYPAAKLVKALKEIDNKDDYFIFFDQNNLYPYAEELLKAGFTKGLFPLKDDFDFEKDRERAMDFVQENYPDVKIIPYQIAKTVEEAKKMAEESDVPMVLQSKGDFVSTICPPDDLEINKKQIMDALDKHASDYAKGEIVLKEKLIKPIEITPQIVFWNGEPVYTTLDLETKNIGDGENNGNQVGCGTNLIIKTGFEDRINKIAFPPKIHHMAKKRNGFFIWDISLYITEKGIFFGEFCSNRLGYDASLTEMSMSGGALAYFSKIMRGENPLVQDFGFSIRTFNLNRQKDIEISTESNEETWLYETKKDGDRMVSLGCAWDLGVVTGTGDTPKQAIDSAYSNYESLSFKEKYARSKTDALSDFPTSVVNRYKMTNGVYYDAPDFEDTDESRNTYHEKVSIQSSEMQRTYEGLIDRMKQDHSKEMDSIREEIKQIING